MAALVSEQTYRRLTGDLRSPVSDVTAALSVAQSLVEVRLDRALGLGEHTESLRVYPSSTVYPSVTPLAEGQDGYLDSCTLQVATGYGYEVWFPYSRRRVTYTGGYTDDTLPQPLAQAICLVAQHLMSPSSGVGMNGIKSYSEGDISATFEHAVDSTWPPGVDMLLHRYRHREAASA
jgi:hypothetical protein